MPTTRDVIHALEERLEAPSSNLAFTGKYMANLLRSDLHYVALEQLEQLRTAPVVIFAMAPWNKEELQYLSDVTLLITSIDN